MTVDDFVKLVDSITKLIGVIVWPILLSIVLVRFGPSLKTFFENLGELSVKGGGFEASAKRRETAVAALAAAGARSAPGVTVAEKNAAQEAAEVVADVVTPRVLRKAQQATVLWVDDRPENNVYERQSLEALGVTFQLAKSTEEALGKIRAQHFDVIISDMGRPPDAKAGYTLLEQLRKSQNKTPFIIYAGSNAPEHITMARERGALGSTNRPSELFEYVLSALKRNI